MSQARWSGRIPPGAPAQKSSQSRPAFPSSANYSAVGASSTAVLCQPTGAAAAPAAPQPCPYPYMYYPYAQVHGYAYAGPSSATATMAHHDTSCAGSCCAHDNDCITQSNGLDPLAAVDAAVARHSKWKTPPIMVPTDKGDIDILQYIGEEGKDRMYRGGDPHIEVFGLNGRVYFPGHTNSDKSVKELQDVIVQRAWDARVELNCSLHGQKKTVGGTVYNYGRLDFECALAAKKGDVKGKVMDDDGLYATNVSQGKRDVQSADDVIENGRWAHRTSKSKRTCCMRWALQYDTDRSQWYLNVGNGHAVHEGHRQKELGELRVDTKRQISAEQRQLLKDLNDVNVANKTLRELLYKRTGGKLLLSEDQASNLLRTESTSGGGEGDTGKTAVEHLFEYCVSEEDTDFIAVFDSYDTDRLTANTNGSRKYKSTKKSSNHKKKLMSSSSSNSRFEIVTSMDDIDESAVVEGLSASAANGKVINGTGRRKAVDGCSKNSPDKVTTLSTCNTDATTCSKYDTAEAFASRTRAALSVGTGDKILLLFATIKKEERAHACRFPEVFFADVTMQTNSERRPMFVLSGKDANNRVFAILRAYMPSQKEWAFDWIWDKAIPTLLQPIGGAISPLERNQLCLMDNDDKEREPFKRAQPKHYPNSTDGLCGWHSVDRGLLAHPPGPLATSGTAAYQTAATCRQWLSDFMREGGVESQAEYDVSRELLYQQLDSDGVKETMGSSWSTNMKNFTHCHIHQYREKFLFPRFMEVRSFGNWTTSPAESVNGSMKRTKNNPTGVRPNQNLDDSYRHISSQANVKAIERNRRAATDLDAVPAWSNTPTSKIITSYGEIIVMEQYHQRNKYHLHRQDESTWLLLRKEGSEKKNRYSKLPAPKFKRVRKVQLKGEHLTCSCCFYQRHGIPCRHVMAVNGLPHPDDIAVRWRRDYGYYYAREGFEDVTAEFNKAIRNAPIGPKITEHAKTQLPQVDEAILNDIEATMSSPVPVLLAPWDGVTIESATSSIEADDENGRKYTLSKEGGMETVVSIVSQNETNEDGASTAQDGSKSSSQYKKNLPVYTDGCNHAETSREAAENWEKGLAKLVEETLKIADETSSGRVGRKKKRKLQDDTGTGAGTSTGGASGGGRMMSCMVEGSDRASMATRAKPAAER